MMLHWVLHLEVKIPERNEEECLISTWMNQEERVMGVCPIKRAWQGSLPEQWSMAKRGDVHM
jgi:hypothetical protein